MSKLVASLPAFHVEKVLQEDSELKSCVLLGHFKLNEVAGKEEEKKCIAILEKQPFQTQQLDSLLKFFKEGKVKIHFENDIYTSTTIYPENEICETQSDYRSPYGIVSRFIYPADLLHIKKYSFQPCEIIEETKKVYTEVVENFILSQLERIQWVYNIMKGKAERERVFYEDNHCVILPDLKWVDEPNASHLYCLVLSKDRNLRSLRDLRGCHVLELIHEKASSSINSRYKLPKSKQLFFMHYCPTYYQLHIHVTNVDNPHRGASVGRAHLLSTVIENLKLCPFFYKEATLTYVLSTEHPLYISILEYVKSQR